MTLRDLWKKIKTVRPPIPPWPPGCGIDWLWRTTDEDINKASCDDHDRPYDAGGFESYSEAFANDLHFAKATWQRVHDVSGIAKAYAVAEAVIYPPLVFAWGAVSYFSGRSKKK